MYGFGYEFNIIEVSVIEQVIKDKGGMGIHTEKENKAGSFSFCDTHETHGMYEDRLQRLEDAVVLMQRHVDYVVEQMTKLEEKIKGFQETLDGTLKSLLVQERNLNDRLLAAYSKLKVKYDNLTCREDEVD